MTIITTLKDYWQAWWRDSFSPATLPTFVTRCPVARRFSALLAPLTFHGILERQYQTGWRRKPTDYKAFLGACLVKLEENFASMAQVRRYLCEHPALCWVLGFTDQRHFDPDTVLPTARHFNRLLRTIPNRYCQSLLDETVLALRDQLPADFGDAISLDTKHILAWVKENNPKAYVANRFDKTHQPKGDPDCKLGCKRRHNRSSEPATPTPLKKGTPASQLKASIGEFYWGYASGVVATKVPEVGEFVLAEYTQPFDASDVSYFDPLMTHVERRLGHKPHFGAFDAAFDAFYIYDYFAHSPDWHDGFAAIPFTQRSDAKIFDADGHPLCSAGLSFVPKYTFTCRTTLVEHERTHYACPLKGVNCPVQHPRAAKGGCTQRLPTARGARLRHQIDRDSSLYKAVYKQRTATERINSQAVALGIERPYLRNRQAITNQNTLIYTLINLRALHRLEEKQHT